MSLRERIAMSLGFSAGVCACAAGIVASYGHEDVARVLFGGSVVTVVPFLAMTFMEIWR